MKILGSLIIFLFLGAWLVQEQETPAQLSEASPQENPKIVTLVASNIPEAHKFKPRIIHEVGQVESHEEEGILSRDPAWENEMKDLLTSYDPIHGERIFNEYVNEKNRHEEQIHHSLALSVSRLSDMNGQSGNSEVKQNSHITDLERQHALKVRTILGDHYEYILEQHQLFKDSSVKAETGDLSK